MQYKNTSWIYIMLLELLIIKLKLHIYNPWLDSTHNHPLGVSSIKLLMFLLNIIYNYKTTPSHLQNMLTNFQLNFCFLTPPKPFFKEIFYFKMNPNEIFRWISNISNKVPFIVFFSLMKGKNLSISNPIIKHRTSQHFQRKHWIMTTLN